MSAQFFGKLKELFRNRDGEWIVSFSTRSDPSEVFDELSKHDVCVEIKRAARMRSLTANAYAWVLLDQLAEKLDRKVVDVYRDEIREVGGASTIVGMRTDAIDMFRRNWESGHLGRQVEVIPGSSKDGWSNVKIYFGSSEFDSRQMSRLISNLIQDAEAQGIPTMTDREVEKLLGKWATKNNEKKN